MPEPARSRAAARPAPTGAPLLAVRGLNAWYGESHVLHGVDFDVARGEVVTLLGRNGAGKTTTLKSIMGIVPRREGSIVFEGRETIRLPSQPHRAPRHRVLPGGARHLREPQRRGEPAAAAAVVREGGLTVEQIFELFPNLKERLREPGHEALRRRAADARDRPHPAHRRAAAAARRADRRASRRSSSSRSAARSRG